MATSADNRSADNRSADHRSADHRSADHLRVALAQINATIGAVDANVDRIADRVEQARRDGADLVVFSECTLLGYPPRDLVEHDRLIDRQLQVLDTVAKLSDDHLGIVVGFVDRHRGGRGKKLRNAAALCHRGEIVGRVFKRLLPTYDVFDEDRYFEAGDTAEVFDFKGVELGISICEDAWNEPDFWERPRYWVDPVAELVDAGADVLVNIAASPFHLDKPDFRRRLLASHARRHRRPMVFVNQVGGHDELIFDGHSLVVGADGAMQARLAAFAPDFVVHDVSVGHPPAADPAVDADPGPSPAVQALQAVTLGVRDYVHKSGFDRAVIGLSGGIDSALTAAVAADALGADNVLGVAMPTRYTRDISNQDARRLAQNLGIDWMDMPIEETFEGFLAQMKPAFDGHQAGVAEENLQARIRGTTLMALSNKLGHLVVVPSNKSEIAVGYSTLYGDLVGALSPLGDCFKTLVYAMARAYNEAAGAPVIPQRTIDRPPSAELRADQSDQDTLPAYDILDAILAAYLHEGLDAPAIVARGFDADVVDDVLGRVFANEYKRWQAAPILKITQKAFGAGWRYPLAASYRALRG